MPSEHASESDLFALRAEVRAMRERVAELERDVACIRILADGLTTAQEKNRALRAENERLEERLREVE